MKASLERTGHTWTADEKQQLKELFEVDAPLHDMAATMGRTPGAVVAQLQQLRLVTQAGGFDYYRLEPYVTSKDLQALTKTYTIEAQGDGRQ